MAVRQEAPAQRGPVIRTPEKRVRGVRNALAVTAAATGLAVAGLLGYEVYKNSQQTPEPTPIAGGIGEPTPAPDITPEITIFLSPSPEITPTPEITQAPTPEISPSPTPEPSPTPDMTKWWNQIPESTMNIKEVPAEGGVIHMSPEARTPYYRLELRGLTIVAIEPDIKNDVINVAVTSGGNKIVKNGCELINVNGKADVNMCNYYGATLWLKVTKGTNIWDEFEKNKIGNGPEALAQYLHVGDYIRFAGVNFGSRVEGFNEVTTADRLMNNKSFSRLKNSVGKSYPRTDKRFSFFTYWINASTNHEYAP